MTQVPDVGLDELEVDALTELINLGVSRAAASLRELVAEQVFLTIPSLSVMSRAEAAAAISQNGSPPLIAVRQAFRGEFSGSALLIFPEASSLELVRAVAGESLSLEDLVELEQEALAEIGNIILNACMATIANLLCRRLTISLPEIVRGSGLEFFELSPPSTQDIVLFIRINFSLKGRDVSGYVAMVMDLLSLASLKTLVAEFIRRSTI
jgi:chemotaxis protein CheC